MGYTQTRNIISYQGRVYGFEFDLNTRTVVQGEIPHKFSYRGTLAKIVRLYKYNPQVDALMEAVIKTYDPQINLSYDQILELSFTHIAIIRERWRDMHDKRFNSYNEIVAYLHAPVGLTDLELDMYQNLHIEDRDILHKYAYQYSKYKNLINVPNNLKDMLTELKESDIEIEMPREWLDFLLNTIDKHSKLGSPDDRLVRHQYELHKVCEGESEHFVYVVPQNMAMIKEEADQQHNCVYWMYGDRIKNGTALVVFIRQKNNPNHSYITCQYTMQGEIVQCYLANNVDVADWERAEIEEYITNVLNQVNAQNE